MFHFQLNIPDNNREPYFSCVFTFFWNPMSSNKPQSRKTPGSGSQFPPIHIGTPLVESSPSKTYLNRMIMHRWFAKALNLQRTSRWFTDQHWKRLMVKFRYQLRYQSNMFLKKHYEAETKFTIDGPWIEHCGWATADWPTAKRGLQIVDAPLDPQAEICLRKHGRESVDSSGSGCRRCMDIRIRHDFPNSWMSKCMDMNNQIAIALVLHSNIQRSAGGSESFDVADDVLSQGCGIALFSYYFTRPSFAGRCHLPVPIDSLGISDWPCR